ncbi:hypothetical protein SK571_11010 [Lentzea sp. BCCO 10_0798]|uniref:Uncharacterized protein n=1 Tax=Lentzea kristufekii TaxID=3095430 RepID=A0ABU4TNP9_9PSEU|nr:hypothetical protein [Lentzea sp. BCCO 10_0798]MDX8049911.1 hypothetical protein [Lentzea sp. BCCO 10_0798]
MATRITIPTTNDLARLVVGELAPQELPSFDIVALPYVDNPRRAERRLRQDRDEPLGLGLGDAAALATPVITLVCGAVVTVLSEELARSVRSGTGKMIRRMIERVRGRSAQKPALLTRTWTPQELAEIRQVALDRALALGVERAKAEVLADTVVAKLALESQDDA